MDITSLVSSFKNISADNKLRITIGKSISNRSFNTNNKIFQDILKGYLNKNGWYLSKQYLSKRYYYEDKYLESTMTAKGSILLGLEVPVDQRLSLYKVESENFKQYRGTYFDIFCQQSLLKHLDSVEEFSEKSESVYNEVCEEVSIFKNRDCNTEIVFNVNKTREPIIFSVMFNISSMDSLETENLVSVFEIVELAMCKYKKTDKKQASVFTDTFENREKTNRSYRN
jgi:hypothetical protein